MPQNLVILAHPNTDSFCAALAKHTQQAAAGSVLRDLYAENFNPILSQVELAGKGSLDPDVQSYQRLLGETAHLILVFPDWWGGPPAILKGWVDRVWRPGVSYTSMESTGGQVNSVGLLQKLRISLVVTSESESPFPKVAGIETLQKTKTLVPQKNVSSIESNASRISGCTHPLVVQWRDHIAAFTGADLTGVLWCGPLREAKYAARQRWLSLAGLLARPG